MDFNSSAIVAMFAPNEASTTVTIPIVCDTEVEGNEQFNLSLTASPPVMLGAQSTAVGIIEDSTGKPLLNVICFIICICILNSGCFFWNGQIQLC